MNLDSIDIRILSLLKENARIKASQISEIVGLSVSSVTERIKKLEKGGVITGYTAVIDQKKIGNNVTALMEVSLEHPKFYDSFAEMIEKTKCIVSCYYISGDFDFMMKILAPSEKLEEIHRAIKSFPGVSGTRTNVVLKSMKTGVSLLPDEK
ncbi:MAG: Lrp/AsnC family transcriptional regulator [Clostridia bacterium]|nr:Lrp/AsnC family transcriptional regulator [Clostridia bacterium]